MNFAIWSLKFEVVWRANGSFPSNEIAHGPGIFSLIRFISLANCTWVKEAEIDWKIRFGYFSTHSSKAETRSQREYSILKNIVHNPHIQIYIDKYTYWYIDSNFFLDIFIASWNSYSRNNKNAEKAFARKTDKKRKKRIRGKHKREE